MTWRCIPRCKIHHLAAAVVAGMIAAHPLPAGERRCGCDWAWVPDGAASAPGVPFGGERVPARPEAWMPPGAGLGAPGVPLRGWAPQPPKPIPEPATWAVLGMGIVGLAMMRNRRV